MGSITKYILYTIQLNQITVPTAQLALSIGCVNYFRLSLANSISEFCIFLSTFHFYCAEQQLSIDLSICTYIVPLGTVIFRLLSTWLAFFFLPYALKACRTDTAACVFRGPAAGAPQTAIGCVGCVPPSLFVVDVITESVETLQTKREERNEDEISWE